MDNASVFDEGYETNATAQSPDNDFQRIIDFGMFVTAEPSFFRWLVKRVDTTPAVSKVAVALQEMIANRDEFQNAKWSE